MTTDALEAETVAEPEQPSEPWNPRGGESVAVDDLAEVDRFAGPHEDGVDPILFDDEFSQSLITGLVEAGATGDIAKAIRKHLPNLPPEAAAASR
ncbi:hypothetical protein [Aeromicrobium sp. 9AM]|uniref:hypothetical protein n=1 Tax=Aeromicrobium sp. 9AM TaxID=2653126 RepID=UPI001358D729|nr:hypothetical protein [Aeromicrobium sp. 9AM]